MADLKLMDSKWKTKVYHDVYRIGAPDAFGEFAFYVEDPHCIITLTKDGGTWQCDKTPAEIAEAISKDRELYISVDGDLLSADETISKLKLLLPYAGASSDEGIYAFSGTLRANDQNMIVTVTISGEGVSVEKRQSADAYILPSAGIPESDLASGVQIKLSKGDSSVQSVNLKTPDNNGDVSIDYTDVGADEAGAAAAVQDNLDTHAGNTVTHVTAADKTAWGAKYDKPAGGVPKSDLAQGVQASLDEADKVPGIEALIPNTATLQNQLADKSFVNSSVATNTANFIDTFNSVQDLEAYSGPVTNNDYAFVVEYDPQDPTVVIAYNRYKYKQSTQQWSFEYTLNNSSFTAEQWAAINSAITADLVASYSSHVANSTIHVSAGDKSTWNAKYNKPNGGIPAADLASDVDLVSDASSATEGQLLTADGQGGYDWEDAPVSLPAGGASGQVLTKQSGADGDVDWSNIPTVASVTGNLTLTASSWVEDSNEAGVYYQPVTIAGSSTNSKVDIEPTSAVINQMLSDGVKSLYVKNNSGALKAVAIGAEPTEDMTVQYQMTIVVGTGTSGSVVNVNDVIQTTGDILVIDGGTSTVGVSELYPNASGISF